MKIRQFFLNAIFFLGCTYFKIATFCKHINFSYQSSATEGMLFKFLSWKTKKKSKSMLSHLYVIHMKRIFLDEKKTKTRLVNLPRICSFILLSFFPTFFSFFFEYHTNIEYYLCCLFAPLQVYADQPLIHCSFVKLTEKMLRVHTQLKCLWSVLSSRDAITECWNRMTFFTIL